MLSSLEEMSFSLLFRNQIAQEKNYIYYPIFYRHDFEPGLELLSLAIEKKRTAARRVRRRSSCKSVFATTTTCGPQRTATIPPADTHHYLSCAVRGDANTEDSSRTLSPLKTSADSPGLKKSLFFFFF